MPQTLEAWQHQLDRHFADLAASRVATKLPIFALEHGLQSGELQEIAELLRVRVARNLPLQTHWLLWVVYATEQGYIYDGHEYWDTFNHNTPHWRAHEDPSQLKVWFPQFQKRYNGVTPTGPWARQFNNIVWPIRHAILPKYLQLQFAEALHGARFKLARLGSLEPQLIGRLLANNAWNASKRFREFLQQEELVGRILLALLNHDVSKQDHIYGPTLKRIVADLETVHRAREWLKEARRAADIFRGASRTYNTPGNSALAPGLQETDAISLRMRPSMLLRRVDKEAWSVILDLPNFSGLAALNPELAAFLKTTRCQVTGEGVWQPAGWLLSGGKRSAVKSWPGAGQPILKFERLNGIIENVLNADFRLSPIPIWLFRVGDDGLAYHVSGLTIRPGHNYILITSDAVNVESSLLKPVNVRCEGIHAVQLTIPDALYDDDIAFLQKLHLKTNRSIRTWPAGFAARSWDGDGYSEWLTTEAPRFGIAHDHPVVNYSVNLDDGPDLTIPAQAPGKPTFIEVPPLLPGRHKLRIRAQRTGLGADSPRDMDGFVTMDVRDPLPWRPGTTAYSGLFVTVEPTDPTLDNLAEGSLAVSVAGPEGSQVSCRLSLSNRAGTQILDQEIAKVDLPLSASSLATKLGHAISYEKTAWKMIEATSGVLTIANEDMGRFSLKLERETRPLRWICRNVDHAMRVGLTDDTGSEAEARLSFRTFQNPGAELPLKYADTLAGITASNPGGLYFACHADVTDSLVVSTPQVQGLQGLLVNPDQNQLASLGAKALLSAATVWSEARLAGVLAAHRRDHVVCALLQAFYAKLCGDRWAKAERDFLYNPTAPHVIEELQRMFDKKSAGFNVVLRRDASNMDGGTGRGTNWFAEVANRYGICSEVEMCETALRISSEPFALLERSAEEIEDAVNELAQMPSLIRGARLVALCAVVSEGFSTDKLTPSWQWH
jgi:hypothetical protein